MSAANGGNRKGDGAFKIPEWTARPPEGYHLDVMKGDKLLQKLMIDEKGTYFFGRNPVNCDFVVDHSSCSRVHAVLAYHKVLKRPFLIDLKSTHGTFIDNVRLEPEKPEPLNFNQPFHFGASTRVYILREKPPQDDVLAAGQRKGEGGDVSLVDTIDEASALERLTEYHTALNRRVIPVELDVRQVRKRPAGPRKRVIFNLVEEVINPEDVDPTVGRFRNLVQTSIVSSRKQILVGGQRKRVAAAHYVASGMDDDERDALPSKRSHIFPFGINSSVVNIAPETAMYGDLPTTSSVTKDSPPKTSQASKESSEKKKYPIEAWPGKYPNFHTL